MAGNIKDSGVLWIGIIPEDWSTKRIKDCFCIISGNGFAPELQGRTGEKYPFYKCSDLTTANDYISHGNNSVSNADVIREGFNTIPVNSILMAKIGEAMKKNRRTLSTQMCCIDNNMQALVPLSRPSIHPKYALYVLRQFNSGDFDNGGPVPSINNAKLKNALLPWPPLWEQETIASYLDSVSALLDERTELLQKQIDVLEHYKKSLIHEAVTKGLDPTTPLKSSGVEWFSTISERWSVKPFKHIASVAANLVEPANYSSEIQIDPENIESDSGRLLNVLTVDEVGSISAKQRFVKGQILYSKIRPALNKVTIAPDDGLCSADMYPITTNENTRWLRYFMTSDAFVSQTVLHSMRVAMPKINVEKLGTVKVAVPPIHEQQVIADYLDEKCTKVDAILDIKRKQVEILKKRRQSLIYEYVTGKRRVGEEA